MQPPCKRQLGDPLRGQNATSFNRQLYVVLYPLGHKLDSLTRLQLDEGRALGELPRTDYLRHAASSLRPAWSPWPWCWPPRGP